ncbi:MAG: ribonuclease R [Bdellovibrionales bacterium]
MSRRSKKPGSQKSKNQRHDGPRTGGQYSSGTQQSAGPRKTNTPNQKIIGVIKRHPDGYGFFIPDDSKLTDVYIAKHNMEGVMTNDKVEILVERDGARFRGKVTQIVERKTKKVSGKVKKVNSSQGILPDESFSWGEDLKVSWPPQTEIKDGDWVMVSIVSYADSVRGFQGQLEQVLGDISDPLNDNIRILGVHNIPNVFSKKSLEEAHRLPPEVQESEFANRTDLRDKKFITIDGKTAKDFDDAIYVEKLGGKMFRLWVAIADVSHYVRPQSAIDKDAYDRGTSTYFPNFVSPMLPEALSNELCSLKPNVPRLTLVAEMDLDFTGELKSSKFYEAVIKSQARVTYGEAQEVVDGNDVPKLSHVKENIKLASELAHILMDRRFRLGSLNLEIPESVVEIDSSGRPTDIIKSERLFAHRLIEELMLQANVAVAIFLTSKNAPALYRIHEPPKEEALNTFERFLDAFGYHKQLGTSQLQKRITHALEEFAGQPQETVINMLALRSMNQAQYSPENVGHFGLGFSHYTHFTSPIRRYPDLIVHRLIKAKLGIKPYRMSSLEELATAGVFLSACEQRSVKAERQIQSIKKARFIEQHLGKEFEGLISSVAKFGVFVTLRQFDVDGLVRVEELGGDHFEFDPDNLRLVGQRSGKVYSIGDIVTVQVAAADHQMGRIDFALPSVEKGSYVTTKKVKPDQERRTPQNNSGSIRQIRVSGHHRKDESKKSNNSRKTYSRKHK